MLKKTLSCALLILALTSLDAAYGQDLNGVWKSNSGGTYYIRRHGTEIWWYGENSPTRPSWSNIAYGKINNKTIQLRWVDIPKGVTRSMGTLTLRVISNKEIRATKKKGGFGDSIWRKKTP
ncbi:MAG: hypothetical protein GY737_09365 [Desulfobacteraceae bacterium]|nr:hypothetical protein [Desulfobacteraceae bacterium]